jgi:hypothetical protein
VPLERGAVYRMPMQVTRAGGGVGRAEKYIVLLQDPRQMDRNATNFAFVIASTDRTGGKGPRSFEVQLGPGDGFNHSTTVDGRWVYTHSRADLKEEDYFVTLNEDRMSAISVAVFIGLQLDP